MTGGGGGGILCGKNFTWSIYWLRLESFTEFEARFPGIILKNIKN